MVTSAWYFTIFIMQCNTRTFNCYISFRYGKCPLTYRSNIRDIPILDSRTTGMFFTQPMYFSFFFFLSTLSTCWFFLLCFFFCFIPDFCCSSFSSDILFFPLFFFLSVNVFSTPTSWTSSNHKFPFFLRNSFLSHILRSSFHISSLSLICFTLWLLWFSITPMNF